MGVLGNEERHFEVVESECGVVELIAICEEAKVGDSIVRSLRRRLMKIRDKS